MQGFTPCSILYHFSFQVTKSWQITLLYISWNMVPHCNSFKFLYNTYSVDIIKIIKPNNLFLTNTMYTLTHVIKIFTFIFYDLDLTISNLMLARDINLFGIRALCKMCLWELPTWYLSNCFPWFFNVLKTETNINVFPNSCSIGVDPQFFVLSVVVLWLNVPDNNYLVHGIIYFTIIYIFWTCITVFINVRLICPFT